jgi:uncharacterized RDD family membrane protein YckC
MDCPQCHNNEISSSGFCMVCGYRLETTVQQVEDSAVNAPESDPELPQWRKELSERLRSIRQKKQDDKDVAAIAPPFEPAEAPQTRVEKPVIRKHAAKAQAAQVPVPQQKLLAPVTPANDSKVVEQLIDKAVARQSPQPQQSQISMPEIFIPGRSNSTTAYEDKFILLSRTLAGLVDLMFVVLCTGIFIYASDFFCGITVSLDFISYAIYAALLLLIYLTYSLFFLSSSTQTIGMMITDLRLVGKNGRRPYFRQILGHCLGYILSLFVLGLGLILSIFDNQNRCFHDRISHTQVIRI